MKTKILSLCLVVAIFNAISASAQPLPPPRDDPFGRMCFELRSQGICSDVCKIFPPNCVSEEEVAKKRECAMGRVNGTLNEKCEPVVLPLPPGAPNDDLSIASRINRGVIYWNLWSDCKGCGWSMDEVILYANNTYASFMHSTKLLEGKGNILGQTGRNGWAPFIQNAMSGVRFVYFNPKLCPTGRGSCRLARNLIVVDDTKASQSRIYSSFDEFNAAEGNPFSCEISQEGAADCQFNLPKARQ